MTDTRIDALGTVWYRNPWYPKESFSQWMRVQDCITLMRNGFPIKNFPDDMQLAIEVYIESRQNDRDKQTQ